ncbi:unnamed protein product [Kuraishia capsulata CBS 1993]|uniref:DUF159-domain-containing protein n=1 Tax=Kuraishia capsulata CBS 1993 TaxID=1382522 RepID=W6MQK8_9ASCO|nr:uncharacterized protein KUCA_T00004957001 [Kuraishia capsulata CBS 1993]CDK28971.1 unnamed protein product [Kuraishia capsulata CBS 1993]
MCGRYAMAVDPNDLPQYFGEQNLAVDEMHDSEMAQPRFNIGPAQYAPVYYSHSNCQRRNDSPDNKFVEDEADGDASTRVIRYMKWGMIPFWTKRISDYSPFKTFNAKAESIKDGHRVWKMVRSRTRCVVPMLGYYEWLNKKSETSKAITKIPYFIKRKDSKLMFLAGLWDKSIFSDEETTHVIYSFSIVTGPAPQQLEWLHHRMPRVLEPGTKEFDLWLDPKHDWDDKLMSCLQPYDKDDLEWFEVSRDVGNVRNEGEHLIQRAPKRPTDRPIKKGSIMNWVKVKTKEHHISEEPSEEEACDSSILSAGPESPSHRFLHTPRESATPLTPSPQKRTISELLSGSHDKVKVKDEKKPKTEV